MGKIKVIKMGSSNDPGLSVTKVHKKEKLMLSNVGNNNNKFYEIELQEGTGRFSYRIYTRYGRLGAPTPAQDLRYASSFWEADEEYCRLIREKEAKSYKIVETEDTTATTMAAPAVLKKTKIDVSGIGDKVLQFVAKIYQEATGFLSKSITTPLGKLSSRQIAKGAEILADIEEILNHKRMYDSYELERLSNLFYSTIPVVFGGKIDPKEFVINDFNKLMDKKDLLGVMGSVVNVQNDLQGTLEEKYEALGAELHYMDPKDPEFSRIAKWIKDSRGGNHHFDISVQNIYVVDGIKNAPKFNPRKVEVMELFHGSRNQNILGILQNSLKIKPASAKHTGSMFGAGVYFANSSTKSANYCTGFGSADQAYDTNYLFVCDVAVGRIKEYTDAQPDLVKAPRPYNSVKGVKGRSLVHDEFIVYNESQAKIKYVVEFKFKR